MTVKSNKSDTKIENKFIKCVKQKLSDNSIAEILFFPVILLMSAGIGYYEYKVTQDKIEYITAHKPLLVCANRLMCGSERYNDYNIVEVGDETKIEVLDGAGVHREYIRFKYIDMVKTLK